MEPPMDESRPLDVLCVGEAMALVVPQRAEPLEEAVDFHLGTGGAESNVACWLAGAGRRVAFSGAVGDDALGRRVLAGIQAFGVDMTMTRVNPLGPTGLYVKNPGHGVIYYRQGSAASMMGPDAVDGMSLNSARIVHISGVSLALSSNNAAMLDVLVTRAATTQTMVSFDVNYRPTLWKNVAIAGASILSIAKRSHIVFVGLDEAEHLWEASTVEAVRALLPEPAHVIIKDGAVDATEIHSGSITCVTTPPVEVVEIIGAGDAFAAGWLDAFLDDCDTQVRLARGHQFAAHALQHTGDLAPVGTSRRKGPRSGQHVV